jgi:hypothetical protein
LPTCRDNLMGPGGRGNSRSAARVPGCFMADDAAASHNHMEEGRRQARITQTAAWEHLIGIAVPKEMTHPYGLIPGHNSALGDVDATTQRHPTGPWCRPPPTEALATMMPSLLIKEPVKVWLSSL